MKPTKIIDLSQSVCQFEELLKLTGEISKLLSTMNLPTRRCDISSEANCRWLLINMYLRNSQHINYERTKSLLNRLLELYKIN